MITEMTKQDSPITNSACSFFQSNRRFVKNGNNDATIQTVIVSEACLQSADADVSSVSKCERDFNSQDVDVSPDFDPSLRGINLCVQLEVL